MSRPPLTERQLAIVSLIEDGMTTHEEIAEELDVSRNAVRRDIAVMCARFGCPARQLPTALEREHAA